MLKFVALIIKRIIKLKKKIFVILFGVLSFNIIVNNIEFEKYFQKSQSKIGASLRKCNDTSKYCDLANHWIHIKGHQVFFRQKSIWYFTDKDEIVAYFVSKSDFSRKVNFKLKFSSKRQRVFGYSAKFIKLRLWRENEFYSLYRLQTNIKSKGFDFNITKSAIRISFSVNNSTQTKWLSLKMKERINSQIKGGAMICVKNYNLNESNIAMLDWWLNLNKLMGYEKVVLYNTSIFGQAFKKLFDNHSSFVEVRPFKFIPNLLDSSNGTFIRGTGRLNRFMKFVFHLITLNECFIDHVDHFKYVAVIDFDELFVPRKLNEFYPMKMHGRLINDRDIMNEALIQKKLNEYSTKCSGKQSKSSDIMDYITDLNEKHQIVNYEKSLYFQMANYVDNRFINMVFSSLDEFLLFGVSNDKSFPYVIKIKRVKTLIDTYTSDFLNLVINDKSDLKYANYLNNLYHVYVKHLLKKTTSEDFLMKTKLEYNTTASISHNFNRFFFTTIKIDKFTGKTLHSVYGTDQVNHHYANGNSKSHRIDFIWGQLSHFRNMFGMPSDTIGIGDLFFDMNYFACYYMPMLNKKMN